MIIAVNFQFKQLEGRSLKNIRASTGFEPDLELQDLSSGESRNQWNNIAQVITQIIRGENNGIRLYLFLLPRKFLTLDIAPLSSFLRCLVSVIGP